MPDGIRRTRAVPWNGSTLGAAIGVADTPRIWPVYAASRIRRAFGPSMRLRAYDGPRHSNERFYIKKVYSLWICFDPPHNRRNTITMYQITEKQLVGEVYEDVACYDLMSVVMICLGTKKG